MRHFCLAPIKNSASEHLQVLLMESHAKDLSFCYLEFGEAFMEKDFEGYREVAPTTNAGSLRRLIKHLKESDSRGVLIQSPWRQYPDWFRWSVRFLNSIYVGYGLLLADDAKNPSLKDSVIKHSSHLLSTTSVEETRTLFRHSRGQVHYFGNPMLWQLRKELESPGRSSSCDLLWAPHWSNRWFGGERGYARWQENLSTIYSFARANYNLKISIRPHPILRSLVLEFREDPGLHAFSDEWSIFKEEMLPDLTLFSALLDLPNVTLSEKTLINDVIESRALLTEGVAIIGYWAATGKPLIVYRDSESPRLSDAAEEILRHAFIAGSDEELSKCLTLALNEESVDRSMVGKTLELFPTFPQSPVNLLLEANGGFPTKSVRLASLKVRAPFIVVGSFLLEVVRAIRSTVSKPSRRS